MYCVSPLVMGRFSQVQEAIEREKILFDRAVRELHHILAIADSSSLRVIGERSSTSRLSMFPRIFLSGTSKKGYPLFGE